MKERSKPVFSVAAAVAGMAMVVVGEADAPRVRSSSSDRRGGRPPRSHKIRLFRDVPSTWNLAWARVLSASIFSSST